MHASVYFQGIPPFLTVVLSQKFAINLSSNAAHVLQFDTMILPDVKDKSSNVFKQMFNFAFSAITGATSNPTELHIPPIDEMRQKCMNHYLALFKSQFLSGKFEENFKLFELVENFVQLYQCCLCQYYESQDKIYVWKESKINRVSYQGSYSGTSLNGHSQ